MIIEIDFNSDEAIYIQIRNQIIMGIATSEIQEGESLPSVRQLAETVGINMHTVNKIEAVEKMRAHLQILLARGLCKDISRVEVHEMVDEIYDEMIGG